MRFALMKGDTVYELIEAESQKELQSRYTPELVAMMVDVTDQDVKQHMTRDARGEFSDPVPPTPLPTPITAERLLAVLITKGVLSADDLKRKG